MNEKEKKELWYDLPARALLSAFRSSPSVKCWVKDVNLFDSKEVAEKWGKKYFPESFFGAFPVEIEE